MKKHFDYRAARILAVMITIAVLFCIVAPAMAEDVIMEKKIVNISFKTDKNGAEYARIIVGEKSQLQGIEYENTATVTGFGPVVADLKAYKKGQTLKAVAHKGDFKGRTTYNVLKVIR